MLIDYMIDKKGLDDLIVTAVVSNAETGINVGNLKSPGGGAAECTRGV